MECRDVHQIFIQYSAVLYMENTLFPRINANKVSLWKHSCMLGN